MMHHMLATPAEAAPVIFIMLGIGFLVLGAAAFVREGKEENKERNGCCTGTLLVLVGALLFLGAGLALYLLHIK